MSKPDGKPARKKLSRRFKIAVGSIVLAVGSVAGGIALVFGTATGSVPLTAEEVRTAQSLFGPDFRTNDIRKHYVQAWVRNIVQYPTAMVPLSQRHIYFFSPKLNKPDLTLATRVDFETYMHEMTHIWQHRGNWAPLCNTYDYKLTPRARFNHFCNEQQARMVGDYSHLFLNPNNRLAVRMLADHTSTRAGNDDLIRVVEQQFPHARKARFDIERHRRQVYRCISSYSVTFNQASGVANSQDQRVITHCFADPQNRLPLTNAAVEPPQQPTLMQRIFGAEKKP